MCSSPFWVNAVKLWKSLSLTGCGIRGLLQWSIQHFSSFSFPFNWERFLNRIQNNYSVLYILCGPLWELGQSHQTVCSPRLTALKCKMPYVAVSEEGYYWHPRLLWGKKEVSFMSYQTKCSQVSLCHVPLRPPLKTLFDGISEELQGSWHMSFMVKTMLCDRTRLTRSTFYTWQFGSLGVLNFRYIWPNNRRNLCRILSWSKKSVFWFDNHCWKKRARRNSGCSDSCWGSSVRWLGKKKKWMSNWLFHRKACRTMVGTTLRMEFNNYRTLTL